MRDPPHMRNEPRVFSRQQLFALVWSTSLAGLGRDLSMGGRGLAVGKDVAALGENARVSFEWVDDAIDLLPLRIRELEDRGCQLLSGSRRRLSCRWSHGDRTVVPPGRAKSLFLSSPLVAALYFEAVRETCTYWVAISRESEVAILCCDRLFARCVIASASDALVPEVLAACHRKGSD